MKRQIVADIGGELDALMREWPVPAGVRQEKSDGELRLVFTDDSLERFEGLETAVTQLSRNHRITLDAIFQARDYSAEDLGNSELLWLQVPATRGLEIVGQLPVDVVRCERCGSARSIRHPTACVTLHALETPSAPLLAADHLKLISNDVLEGLAAAGMTAGLETTPTVISRDRRPDDRNYRLMTSNRDLGEITGDVQKGPACEVCAQRPVLRRRTFQLTFDRSRWTGEDFSTTSFLGLDTLIVSQRVYRHLVDTSVAGRSGAIFEPVLLE